MRASFVCLVASAASLCQSHALIEDSASADVCASGVCVGAAKTKGISMLQLSQNASTSVKAPLPPPFLGINSSLTLPEGGVELAQREEKLGTPSPEDMKQFQLVKELRTQGYQCKSKYFPGDPNTEQTFLFDCRLWRAARKWSEEMGNGGFFAHKHEGSDPCIRTQNEGLSGCWENIAAGSATAEATTEQWKQSDGHCLNMMNPGLNRFGVGYAAVSGSRYTHYWTQNFGVDNNSPPDQSCLRGAPAPAPQTPQSPQTPQTPAPTPAPTPQSPTGVPSNGGCKDLDGNCAKHYKEFCFDARIKQTCPLTCGECSSCVDSDPNCATSYGPYCFDDRIKKTCPKTCGTC